MEPEIEMNGTIRYSGVISYFARRDVNQLIMRVFKKLLQGLAAIEQSCFTPGSNYNLLIFNFKHITFRRFWKIIAFWLIFSSKNPFPRNLATGKPLNS